MERACFSAQQRVYFILVSCLCNFLVASFVCISTESAIADLPSSRLATCITFSIKYLTHSVEGR